MTSEVHTVGLLASLKALKESVLCHYAGDGEA